MRSHRRNHLQKRVARRGFTLIELLVVVGIALLLTTFTVIGIDFTFESERVRSGSRQLQSMLEGARDRAIFAREPRGVRFLLDNDPLNGRKVSSMVYIGAGEEWREGSIILRRPDFVDNSLGSGNPNWPHSDGQIDALDFDNDGASPETELFMVEGSPETLWNNLLLRGYLPPFEYDSNGNNTLDPAEDINSNGVWDQRTARIKIPGDKNGTWYTVSTYWLGRDPQRPNRLQLMTQYRDPGTTPDGVINGFEDGAGPTSYILELPPRVLPDAEPILLPGKVVIDLDGSAVPDSWRPPAGAAETVPYSNRMDILFSPRGTVTGPESAAGLLHFYLTLAADVDDSFVVLNRPQVNQGDSPRIPGDGQFSEEKPVGDRALVSVFTQTGKVAAFPLNTTDADSDGYADDPFSQVTRGKGLTQ
ncbi:MAG: prepilin-type N-terminal cleavage/methylation domain-containing protein [Planctomycetes bacterium]|nr:prepilin-type N-terminal cleavage/methylation domain-containing protein [Planctomycetota bacterium]